MTTMDPLELFTIDEVATIMKVKKSWIYDQVAEQRFPVVRLGKHLRFRRQDLEDYLTAARDN